MSQHDPVTPTAHREFPAGWSALRAGDAAAARAVFGVADREIASGEALEGLARTCYLESDFVRAIGLWEQAYAASRAGGSRLPEA